VLTPLPCIEGSRGQARAPSYFVVLGPTALTDHRRRSSSSCCQHWKKGFRATRSEGSGWRFRGWTGAGKIQCGEMTERGKGGQEKSCLHWFCP
jgi:hypothetical protein